MLYQPIEKMQSVNFFKPIARQSVNVSAKPLFSYMNAGVNIKNDGTKIAYMNANNTSPCSNGSDKSGSTNSSVSYFA